MNEWSHLPNASHIDWVLASVKQYPAIWTAACGAAWEATSEPAWKVAWDAAWDAAYSAARGATYAAVRSAVQSAVLTRRWGARNAVQNAILALISYDDCAYLLDMSGDQLKTWALLSEQPAAMLLLPAVIAREQIRELEQA